MFGSRYVNVTEVEFVVVSLLVPSELLYVTLYDETSEMVSLVSQSVSVYSCTSTRKQEKPTFGMYTVH